jgi:hypothetical protein
LKQDTEKKEEDQEPNKPRKLNLDVIKEKYDLKGEKETSSSTLMKVLTSCTSPELGEEEGQEADEAEPEVPPSPEKPKRLASVEGGISRLEDFITEADKTLAQLTANKDAAILACQALSKYCGESGGEQAATSLLGILSQFATNLSDAVKKYDRRLELEARKEAQAQKDQQQTRRKDFVESKGFGQIVVNKDAPPQNSTAPKEVGLETPDRSSVDSDNTPSSDAVSIDVSQLQGDAKAKVVPKSKDGSSLVSMVNKMLKDASPQAREDFQAGIVYDGIADETLKAIYEKERKSISSAPPRRKKVLANANLDLFSQIKQRRDLAE